MKVHLDTNGLLACILDDRPVERERIADWVHEHGSLVVDECVLAEACWVLERVYMHPRAKVARLLQVALETEEVVAWDRALAGRALELMQVDPKLSIVDCILVSRAHGGELVLTFDRRLERAMGSL